MTQAATRIERVHVHADALDAGRARLRLGSLLERAELRPQGLPPAAVLCVRRVCDPLPGALRLETADARPPPDWTRAFVESLERKLRSAARPAHEAVPAAAEAVLFADRAELLACLARDARDGTAWLHWWWRDLHGSPAGDGDPVVAAWLETPEHVPAALQLLAARREAVPFVAALPARAAAALTLRVAAAHGLAELRHAAAAPTPPAPTDRPSPVDGRAPPLEPPWRQLVPESAERPLAPPVELLLGMSLVLRRDPQLARTSSFATATRAWLAAAPVLARASPPRVAAAAQELADEATPLAEPTPPPQPVPDRGHAVRDRMTAPDLVRPATAAAPEQTQPPTPEPAATETAAAARTAPSPETALGTAAQQYVAETTSSAPTFDAPAPIPERRPEPRRSVRPRAPRKHKHTKCTRA